jgi:hypothetical protein
MHPTKRAVLAGGLLASLAATSRADARRSAASSAASDLTTYIGFGVKASGGAGDTATGSWIEERLAALGLATTRQSFEVPYFDPAVATLQLGANPATFVPLMPAATTSMSGLEAPFAIIPVERLEDTAFEPGSLVAIVLPHRRWSTAAHPMIQNAIATGFARGAGAIMLVTTGPTGEAIALNVAHDAKAYAGPVGILGPNDLAALVKTRRSPLARFALAGQAGTRAAFNVVANTKTQGANRIVVSTPRSGWGICAGERGPGVAAFLDLAAWLAQRRVPATFVCTSGHEFENMGGALFLRERAPKPAEVALWVHLGANLAARDWHETGRGLLPLPSADPQRFLMASADLLPAARSAFAGLPGLENPYELSAEAQGELKEIRAANYTRAIGIFGAHRYHHTPLDDERAVSAALVAPVLAALQKFISMAAGRN